MGQRRFVFRSILACLLVLTLSSLPLTDAQTTSDGQFTSGAYLFKPLQNGSTEILDAKSGKRIGILRDGKVVSIADDTGTIRPAGFSNMKEKRDAAQTAYDSHFAAAKAASPASGERSSLGTLHSPETLGLVQKDLLYLADVNLLRLNQNLFDDPNVMKYFILLNNCRPDSTGGPADFALRNQVTNEVQYPQLVDFYKPKTGELLTGMPTAFKLALGEFRLGQYDLNKGSFPILSTIHIDQPGQVAVGHRLTLDAGAEPHGNVLCQDASRARTAAAQADHLPKVYAVTVERALSFGEMPMTKDAASKYLESAGAKRPIFAYADMELLDSPPPRIDKNCPNIGGNGLPIGNGRITCAVFAAKVIKITVLKVSTTVSWMKATPAETLGVLYP
jgi:hypothetical protein